MWLRLGTWDLVWIVSLCSFVGSGSHVSLGCNGSCCIVQMSETGRGIGFAAAASLVFVRASFLSRRVFFVLCVGMRCVLIKIEWLRGL